MVRIQAYNTVSIGAHHQLNYFVHSHISANLNQFFCVTYVFSINFVCPRVYLVSEIGGSDAGKRKEGQGGEVEDGRRQREREERRKGWEAGQVKIREEQRRRRVKGAEKKGEKTGEEEEHTNYILYFVIPEMILLSQKRNCRDVLYV